MAKEPTFTAANRHATLPPDSPKAKKILVYYNPRNSAQAVLVPGADLFEFLYEAASGLGMAVVGAVFLAGVLSVQDI
jgi:hypothetical protein